MSKSGRHHQGLRVRLVVGASVAAMGLAGQAVAETAQTAAVTTAVDEVVVTALKRSTRLLDTPAAVTAVGPDQLAAQQVNSLADLSTKVPSLQTGQAAGVDYVAMRGISINSTTGGIENPVAIHVDGVYLAQPTALDFLMLDPASVEVLRGPQGTLYGRNSTGGAINFVTAKPTETFEASLDGTWANYGTFRVNAAISGPIAPNLAGRIAVMGAGQAEGFTQNLATGASLGPMLAGGVRGALRYTPTDAVTVDLSAFYYDEDNDGIVMQRLNRFNATARARNPILSQAREYKDIRNIYLSDDPAGRRWFDGAILTGRFELSPQFSLKTISSYTEIGIQNLHSETDGTDIRLGTQDRHELTSSWQQEVDLDFKLFDGRLNGVVGVFYDQERWKLDSVLNWPANPQGFVSLGPVVPINTATISHFRQTTTAKAAFTDFEFKITDAFSLYAGYRVSQDKRELLLTTGLAGLPNQAGLAACNNRQFEATFDSNTGKIGARYGFASGGNAYVQYQQGFKAGGFNPFGCNDTYDPEELAAYEAGYKTRLFDGALTLSLAAFHYDYTNLQVAQIINATNRIENAASAKLKGLEIESQWRITSRLRADLALAFLDSQYESYRDLDTLNPALGVQDLSGKPLNRAPKSSGTLGLEADLPIGEAGDLTLRGELFNTSRIYFRPYGATADSQEAYSLVNLYATYRPVGSSLTFRAFVKNATDEEYLVGLFSAGLFADRWAAWGAPRTYGVGLGVRF